MIRFSLWRKIIAQIVALVMLAQLAPVALFAAEGPGTPEASQFEPVDTSDLVNLYTGDFTYNIPLLEVSGPEGNWPVNLAYHAGISPNAEATWVGLGWTLNPGAINRFVSGYPDDYYGGGIFSTFGAHGKGHGFNAGISIAFGPASVGLSYNSQMGFGYNLGLSLASLIGYRGPGDIGASYGSSGANIGASLGTSMSVNGHSFGASVGAKINDKGKLATSMSGSGGVGLAGVSFSSRGGTMFSAGGLGLSSTTVSSNNMKTKIDQYGFSFAIPVEPIRIDINLGYYETEWWIKQLNFDAGIGTIHQNLYRNYWEDKEYTFEDLWGNSDNVINDFKVSAEPQVISELLQTPVSFKKLGNKMERSVLDNDVIVASEDLYVVNAQGLSGTFRPFVDYGYTLEDDDDDRLGQFAVQNESERNYSSHIKFRMEGDPGGNFIAKTGSSLDYGQIGSFGNQYGSRRIYPAIDTESGKIVGFKIVAEDGKIYEFFRAVYSYMDYTYNEKNQYDLNSQNITTSKYATSWLLTGIKGPDYIDRGTVGMSADDYGFWVKFSYVESSNFLAWRTPFTGYIINRDEDGNSNKDSRSYSTGLKNKVYLESIETATHLARFVKSDRDDDLPAFGYKDFSPNQQPNMFRGNTLLLAAYKAITVWKSNYLGVECQQGDCGGGGSNYSPSTRIIFDIPYKKIQELKDYAIYYSSPVAGYRSYVKMLHRNYQNGTALDDPYSPGELTVGSSAVALDLFRPYDADSSQSYIDHDNFQTVPWSATASGYVFLTAWLEIPYNPSSTLKKYCKKLDQVRLHKKILNSNNDLTDYVQTYASPIIEGTTFNYDYSLCKNAPNSNAVANGKLTLKSLRKFGKDTTYYLPSTNFTYSNNPDYLTDKWDLWNGYTSEGTLLSHFNSNSETIANNDAAAWNLTSIESPLGATISINYESDRIQYLSYATMSLSNQYTSIAYITGQQATFTVSDITKIQKWFDYGYRKFMILENQFWEDNNGYCQFLGNGVNYFGAEVEISSIAGNQITLSLPYDFKQNEDVGCGGRSYSYSYSLAPLEGFLGGGHRVKSIVVQDGDVNKKTLYRYYDGVTPALPSAYKFYNSQDPLLIQYPLDSRMSKGFNVLGPSPSVGYAKVDVFEADPNSSQDIMLNGKTTFEYFTAKDFPFNPTLSSNVLTIDDKTGIYGQIKNIRTYKLDQGVLKILKEDKRMYQFSKDLLTTNVTPVNGVAADQKSRWLFKSANDCVSYTNTPIGLIQQKYWTKNEDDPVTYINHIKQGVYLVGTQSVEYFYDPNNNSNGSSSITNYNIAFDANAGLVLTTEFKDSKGDRIVNENRPAYWFYSSMKNKNMLTQMAEQRLYDISAAAGEVLVYDPSHQCDGTIESWILPHLKSASITTWKNWLTAGTDWNNDGSIDYLDQIWRQNDTYTSNKIGSSFVYFSNWTVADNETSNPGNYDLPNGWKRTSNITAYDRFGHPTEERGLDGTYTSSIYGYGDALPVAIAQNALNTQIKFFNFEDPANASGGKTGAYSKSYSGTVAELSTPSVTGTYVISGWVKPTSSTTINGVSYPANGQWQFFEVKNLAQNTTLSITAGAGNIDDVRIHPVEATMSTFTYDILTWKVTAISDANSIITYYEYDDVGRLIKVFDQDKNMIKKHTYQYKRNVN